MQKFLQLIKREWEITTLAVTTAIVLVAAAAWVSAFIFGKDGTIEKPTVLPQPPQYFNTDNTDYLNYYAVNKAKVKPFLFKHKVPPTTQPAPKASTPPPKPSDKPSDKPAPKPEPKQPDKPTPKPADKPAPPPPPPHLAFLSYNGFYQGISGIPQALITYDDKGKGKNNTKPFSKDLEVKASEQFESLFSLKSLDQEKIVVIFQGKEYTVKRGENKKFTLPE